MLCLLIEMDLSIGSPGKGGYYLRRIQFFVSGFVHHGLLPKQTSVRGEQLRKETAGVPQQRRGGVALAHSASVHHDDAVRVHDRVQPMSDGEDRARTVSEFRSDGPLNEGVSLKIDRRCRLVQQQNPTSTNQGSRTRLRRIYSISAKAYRLRQRS